MNALLRDYFFRLKSTSKDSQIQYSFYERDPDSQIPFSVHLQFIDEHNNTRDSWGSGPTKDEALGKALMEMIERIYFTGYSSFEYKSVFGIFPKRKNLFQLSEEFEIPIKLLHPANTNGVAIHNTLKKSLKAGLLELIERHVILYSIVSEIGPHYKIKKKVAKDRHCSFYIWKSPLKTFTVVGAYTDERGTYFSSGCDFIKEVAIAKAELELNSFLYLNEETSPEASIVKEDLQSFNRYHKYSGDFSAVKFLETASKIEIPNLSKDRFYYSEFPVPFTFKGLKRIPAVRVLHPDVQQLFFDNWHLEYLNPRIFHKDQKLPGFPHIIA